MQTDDTHKKKTHRKKGCYKIDAIRSNSSFSSEMEIVALNLLVRFSILIKQNQSIGTDI